MGLSLTKLARAGSCRLSQCLSCYRYDSPGNRVTESNYGDGALDPAPKSLTRARATFCCTTAVAILTGLHLLIFLQPAYPLDVSSWSEYTCKSERAFLGDSMKSAVVEIWIDKCGLESEGDEWWLFLARSSISQRS